MSTKEVALTFGVITALMVGALALDHYWPKPKKPTPVACQDDPRCFSSIIMEAPDPPNERAQIERTMGSAGVVLQGQ